MSRISHVRDFLRVPSQILNGSAAQTACPRRAVFLHIPKCAGSSVHDAFVGLLGHPRHGQAVFIDDRSGRARLRLARGARYAGGHFGAMQLQNLRKDAVTFTFLRDPFDRLVSAWRFARTLQQPTPLGACETFEDALRSDHPSVREGLDNVIARQLAAAYDLEMAGQVPREEWVDRARTTLASLDHVGRLDRIDADFTAITGKIGITGITALTPANRTDDPHRRNRRTGAKAAPVSDTPALRALAEPLIELDRQVVAGWL